MNTVGDTYSLPSYTYTTYSYKYIVINQGPKDELRLIENLRNGYKISTLNHTNINKIGKTYGS